MEIFSRFAKLILISIIGMFIFSTCVDIGRGFQTESHNNFIAHNASSYVTKFTVEEKDLIDFKDKSITEADAHKALLKYYKAAYDGYRGYYYDAGKSKTASGKYTLYFSNNDTAINGPIIIRYRLSGFDGSSNLYDGTPGVGFIQMNIEQKYPSTSKRFIPESVLIADNDGFKGYMSAISSRSFLINTLDSAF